MKKLFLFIIIGLCAADTIYGAGLGGTVYVPNLHAKCLSQQQECILECAAEPDNTCDSTGISTSATLCAKGCMEEYEACEQLLDKLRCIDDYVPIKPRKIDVDALMKRIEEKKTRYENS